MGLIDWLIDCHMFAMSLVVSSVLYIIYLWINGFIDWLVATISCYEPMVFSSVPIIIHLSVNLWVCWLIRLTQVPGMNLGFYFQFC